MLDKAKKEGRKYDKITNYAYQLFINKQLMDLKSPNIPEESIDVIQGVLQNPNKEFYRSPFLDLYKEDNLGNSIPNVQMWLHDTFEYLQHFKVG